MGKRIDRKSRGRSQTNYWKWAFLILLGIIIAFGAYIGIKLNMSSYYYEKNFEKPRAEEEYDDKDKSLTFETKFTEEQFNSFLEAVLMPEDSPYEVYFEKEKIHLAGKVSVVGMNVPVEIEGVPNALDDGNIDIHITDIEAGSFNLPTSIVVKAFSLLVPENVPMSVDSKRNVINIDLMQIAESQGMLIRAKEINASDNTFIFEITVPEEILKNTGAK